jgi:broad-specificity NMP kinase
MKCLAIGGVPASGKTTLMRLIINRIKPNNSFKFGLLRGHVKGQTSILGIYQKGEVFAGTDKLSMAVQADFDRYLSRQDANIAFEGDRLFTGKNLIKLADSHDTRIVILKADAETLKQRHLNRGDTQSEKFLKSRITKIDNILKIDKIISCLETHEITTLSDTEDLATELTKWKQEK